MKNKKTMVVLFSALFLALFVLAGYRYYDLNRAYPDHSAIKEKIIPMNQEVKTKSIEYKVLSSKVNKKKSGKEVDVDVFIYLKLLAPNRYGYKPTNFNFSENMYLHIPYYDPTVAYEIYKENGEWLTLKDTKLNQPMKLRMHFDIPKEEYELKKEKMRFNFLVPEKENSYIKYSTLIPY